MRPTNCPTPADLAAFARGDLPSAAIDEVASHLEGCPSCDRAAEQLDAVVDPLAAVLRGLAAAPPADGRTGTWSAGLAAAAETVGPTSERTLPPADARPRWFGGYEVLEELGRGGMGVVYKGFDPDLKRFVALKVILAGGHATPAESVRFHREAEAAARVRHPNLIQIYEIGQHDGLPFLALEYAAGGGLDRFLRGEPQPVRTAVSLVATLASAVQACHAEGVVHRDLKPANILLDGPGLAGPKVTDFGLAKWLDGSPAVTASGTVAGTPSYMPPEQASGQTGVGPAADVYALGAILYELLTGRPPFRGAAAADTLLQVLHDDPVAPSRLRRGVPRDLETVCLKCLAKDPRRRYATAGELADDLSRFLAGDPVRARPTGTVVRLARRAKRYPVATALLILAVASLLGGTATATHFAIRATEAAALANSNADRASENARQANENKDLAVQQKSAADEARDHARTTLYAAQTHLAGQATVLNKPLSEIGRLLAAWRPEPGKTDLRGWEWYYLDALGRQDELRVTHASAVLDVAWAPGGDRLAVAEQDGPVRVRSADGAVVAVLGERPARCVAWSPDGATLATGGADGVVRLWTRDDWRERAAIPRHEGAVRTVSWSPDGAGLGSAGESDDRIIVGDPTGKADQTLPVRTGNRAWADTVSWSPDWKQVAIGNGGSTRVVSVAGGEAAVNIQGPPGIPSWSADGRRLAVCRIDTAITIADPATGSVMGVLRGHRHRVAAARWSPDGATLASAGFDGTVRLWDVAGGRLRHTYLGHTHEVHSVAWTATGDRLATGGLDGLACVWSSVPPSIPVVRSLVSASWSRDADRVVVAGLDRRVRVYGRWTRTTVGPAEGYPVAALHVAWSPTAERVACATNSGAVVLDLPVGNQSVPPLRHPGPAVVRGVDWSPDGRWLATISSTDPEVRVWDAASGQLRTAWADGRTGLLRVAWSPDGRYVAVSGPGGVRVGDPFANRLVARFDTPEWVDYVVWSPDSRRVAAGGRVGRVLIWYVHTGQLVRELTGGGRDWVKGLTWAPDGKRVAVASVGNGVQVWNPETGDRVLTCDYEGELNDLAWSPDGGCLAGADWSAGHLVLWDAAASYEAHRPAERLRYGRVASRADELLRRGRPADAVTLAGEARAAAPADPAVLRSAADIDRRAAQMFRTAGKPTDAVAAERRAAEDFRRVLAADPDDAAAVRGLTDVLLQPLMMWHVLTPSAVRSQGGADLSIQPDGSILAGGTNPPRDAYRVTARTDLPRVAAIRLETLRDASLPAGGAGRFPGNGNFLLTGLRLATATGKATPVAARLTAASADAHSARAASMVAGVPGAVWDTFPAQGDPHWLTARAEPPAAAGPGTTVEVVMEFRDRQWPNTALGRFRLAVTDDPRVFLAEVLRTAPPADLSEPTRLAAALFLTGNPAEAVGRLRPVEGKAAAADVCGWLVFALAKQDLGEADEARLWYDRSARWLRRHAAPVVTRELAVEASARVGGLAPADARAAVTGWEATAAAWSPGPWLARGNAAAAAGAWREAAQNLGRAVENRPADGYNLFAAGMLLLYAGDVSRYRIACDELLDRADRSHDAIDAERAAKVCLLRPSGDRLARAARFAYAPPANPAHEPYVKLVRGLAEYRLGDFDAAESWLKSATVSADASRVAIPARFVLAMVHSRRGEADAARSELDRALGLMKQAVPTPAAGGHWPDWVFCALLADEAQALVRGTGTTP